MTTLDWIVGVGLVAVLAWLFWPRRAKRHDHGYMPKTWQSGHAKILEDELRQERARRSGRQ